MQNKTENKGSYSYFRLSGLFVLKYTLPHSRFILDSLALLLIWFYFVINKLIFFKTYLILKCREDFKQLSFTISYFLMENLLGWTDLRTNRCRVNILRVGESVSRANWHGFCPFRNDCFTTIWNTRNYQNFNDKTTGEPIDLYLMFLEILR